MHFGCDALWPLCQYLIQMKLVKRVNLNNLPELHLTPLFMFAMGTGLVSRFSLTLYPQIRLCVRTLLRRTELT